MDVDVCVFLWNGENYVGKEKDLISSLRSNGINCLLFSSNAIDYYLSPEGRKDLIDFISALDSAGIKFEILLSRNDWIFPENRRHLFYILDLYRDFLETFGKDIPVNLDIEPHAIEGQRDFIDPDIWNLYIETLTQVRNRVNYLNPLISYVYRYYGFDEDVVPLSDTLVVMLYITDLSRIEENVVYYREITAKFGKGLRIAFSVEKDLTGGESFYKESKGKLKEALKIAENSGADGIVLQDYENLMSYLTAN